MFNNTATMEGLHHWFKNKFEQLGWMVLAKNRASYCASSKEKLKAYKSGLVSLKKHLEEKIDKLHEQDRKDDLLILHSHVCELIVFVTKNFRTIDKPNSRKKKKKPKEKSLRSRI